jgi:hypothetical protein
MSKRTNKQATDHHNAVAGPIVASIVKPILEAEGNTGEVATLLESVVVGTIRALAEINGFREGPVRQNFASFMLATLQERVLERLEPGPFAGR